MCVDRLTDDISHSHTGIQARIGILEYDLHFLAVWEHICELLLLHIENHVPIVNEPSFGRLIQPQKGSSGRGLSAPGFSDQSQRLSTVDGKCHIVHCLNIFFVFAKASCQEILTQMLYFN